jgi:UDP-N-acetylglucosamine:LPS N-acetylglucosamine transferase
VVRDDVSAFDCFGLSFSEILASCDAVLTKPGYGTFTEASCAGVPVLYVARHDWPEEPYLVQWLSRHGICVEVPRTELESGKLEDLLWQLWSTPHPNIPSATGAQEAASYLAGMLCA